MSQCGYSRTLVGRLLIAGWAFGAAGPSSALQTIAAAPPPPGFSASTALASIDPSHYLISEKYDGVRAVWNGRELRFRSGRRIAAPQWFLQRLPDRPLDGELWLGRGQFDALSGLVRGEKAPDDERWRQVRYMIFELPGAPGGFAERVAQIQRIVDATGWPQLQAAPQQRIVSPAVLDRLFVKTVADGGEGLMLHLATAAYSAVRSDAVIKMKPHHDAEAVVIGHRPGRGRLTGKLGAIRVQAADGREFWVGTGFSDAQRLDPPAIGTQVTYRFRELTANGQPRFATFLRIREDL